MLLPAAWLGLNCAIWAAAAAGSVAAEIGPPVLDTNVVPEKVVGGNSAKYAASSAGLKLLSADTWPKVAFENPCELTLEPDVVTTVAPLGDSPVMEPAVPAEPGTFGGPLGPTTSPAASSRILARRAASSGLVDLNAQL